MNRLPSNLSRRVVALAAACGLLLTPVFVRAEAPEVAELTHHLEAIVPALLEESGVPGAAVGVVHEGRVVYLAGFGWGDPATNQRVTPATVFNVGSISKTLTAWGVMSLAERGEMGLETRVDGLLPGWPLSDGSTPKGVTVERLLGHTSGVSTPSVPEYLPWQEVEGVEAWLASSEGGVHMADAPGEDWSYSGAGYSLLQLAIESVRDEGFDETMRREVFEPLDMMSSTFRRPVPAPSLARPHDNGRPIPYRRYSGLAAAGLYSSVEDLAGFLAAHSAVDDRVAGRGVVSEEALELMRTPQPLSLSPYNTAYGLGYSVWPLPSGELTSGHRGQNHGWSAIAWLSADGADGLVVLTNDSNGESLYRWVFCDWARWLAGEPSFGGYCSRRDEHPSGPLFSLSPSQDQDLARLIRSRVSENGPGVAALVARAGEVLLRDAVGLADVEEGVAVTPSTPFYIASLAKPLTAAVVLDLVARGDIALDDKVAELLPEFPTFGRPVTVRHLLRHTSGTPDFWDFHDWSRLAPMDNAHIFQRVRDQGEPHFAPGTRFEYSNTGWMGLASLAERVTGKTFADLLVGLWPTASSSSALYLLDDDVSDLPQRARGYGLRGGSLRLVDYRRFELPGIAPVEPHFSMIGAGGLVSNVDGLFTWAETLLSGELLPEELVKRAVEPGLEATGIEGLGGTPHAGLGLFLSEFEGHRLWWHDGNMAGHQSLMIIDPDAEIVIVLLSNSSEMELRELAREILVQIL